MKASRPSFDSSSSPTFRFRVVRAFKALDDGERKKWVVVAAARDLPQNLPLDANARVPNVRKNATCAEMRATLLNSPELFQVFNGGIVCTATTVESRQDGNEHFIEIKFDPDREQGIVNGGHSYATLLQVLHRNSTYSSGLDLKTVLEQDARQETADLVEDEELLEQHVANARAKAQVQIEFVAPVIDSEMLAKIARARNLSQSVESTALANLAGKFDLMKEVLGKGSHPLGPELVNRVVWKTNQEVPEGSRSVAVKLLIQILALMNTRSYPPGQRLASEVYNRASAVIREFSEAEGEDEEHFRALTRLLPELVRFYDHIYASLPEVDPTFPWADGKLDKERKRESRPATTPVLAIPCATRVVNAFIWPIFAAFRLLIVPKEDGSIGFKSDPVSMFDEMKNQLANSIIAFHRNQANGHANQVGRDKEIWVRIEGALETELKVREQLKVREAKAVKA